jgi:uncharacterized protein with GYD domain
MRASPLGEPLGLSGRRCEMFTYVGLIKLTPEGRENLEKAPEYIEKIRHIVEEEGGKVEQIYAMMGPWDFFALVKYPDTETAFKVLAKIGLLEVVKTETFPAEPVEVFVKAFA